MADLTFGESLGQLVSSSYNPWVNALFGYAKVLSLVRIFRAWPGLTSLVNVLVPSDIRQKSKAHVSYSYERVDERMARKTERPDIWDFVSKHTEAEGYVLATTELHSNGATFMLAGTETTATELSGLTYLLLKHPAHLERLTKELRGSFSSLNDMTMTKLSRLEFLNACLEEGLRIYPPVPVGLPRRIPKEGATICGHWVAGGVSSIENIRYVCAKVLISTRLPYKLQCTPFPIRQPTGYTPTHLHLNGSYLRGNANLHLIGGTLITLFRSAHGTAWARSRYPQSSVKECEG